MKAQMTTSPAGAFPQVRRQYRIAAAGALLGLAVTAGVALELRLAAQPSASQPAAASAPASGPALPRVADRWYEERSEPLSRNAADPLFAAGAASRAFLPAPSGGASLSIARLKESDMVPATQSIARLKESDVAPATESIARLKER